MTCSLLVGAWLATAQAGPPAVVEFRWLEDRYVEGLTEKEGRAVVCGGPEWFPHKKPVLSGSAVASAKLGSIDGWPGGPHYSVDFTLTAEARRTLAAEVDSLEKLLTVWADGKSWGVSTFRRDAPDKFSPPGLGFTTSKALAEGVAGAFPKEPAARPKRSKD